MRIIISQIAGEEQGLKTGKGHKHKGDRNVLFWISFSRAQYLYVKEPGRLAGLFRQR